MPFVFETVYDRKALAAMCKALRKTVRRKHSRRSHIFGWIVMILGLLLTLPLGNENYEITGKNIFTWVILLVMFLVLLFEDQLNGFIAKKRMLKGTEKGTVTFLEEEFISETEVGTTHWNYDRILILAEDRRYITFVFSQNHAQCYDKLGLKEGELDAFRNFIEGVTNKKIAKIK